MTDAVERQLQQLNREVEQEKKWIEEIWAERNKADTPLLAQQLLSHEAELEKLRASRTELEGRLLGRIAPEEVRQIFCEELATLRQELAAARQPVQAPKKFSTVGSGEVEGILEELDIIELDGNDLEPVEVPSGLPTCEDFDYSAFPNENAGTPALLAHHQKMLQKFGVHFGRGGFKMQDLHDNSRLFRITTTSGQEYGGSVAGSVSPYGLAKGAAAAKESRMFFEHKQGKEDRQKFYAEHPEYTGKVQTDSDVRFSSTNKGQSIIAVLAGCAYNNFPVMLDLTDGKTHHLLQLRKSQDRGTPDDPKIDLYVWEDLTSTQAYYKLTQLLMSLPTVFAQRHLALESIPEDMQLPAKKLRCMKPSSALREQLDSVIPMLEPEERLQASFELINEFRLPMPAVVERMFG